MSLKTLHGVQFVQRLPEKIKSIEMTMEQTITYTVEAVIAKGGQFYREYI